MDPATVLGLAASVETLAGLAATTFCSMYQYYESVRDAPKRAQELRQEMSAIGDQLNALAVVMTRNQSNVTVTLPPSFKDSISEFETMLRDMYKRVTPPATKGLKRLAWPFSKEENDRLLSRIERYKSMVDLALNVQTA